MKILRDKEIEALLKEPKILPDNWQSQIQPKDKNNFQHQERSFEVKGESGSSFRVIICKNKINIFDFSIILIYQDSDGKEYRLLRYNGKPPSEHTNKWEEEQGQNNCKFSPAFHIHKATGRYQEAGYPIATITCLQYEKFGVPFVATAVFENQEEINRRVLARFSDICEKQFPSLQSAKERFDPYWREILSR